MAGLALASSALRNTQISILGRRHACLRDISRSISIFGREGLQASGDACLIERDWRGVGDGLRLTMEQMVSALDPP